MHMRVQRGILPMKWLLLISTILCAGCTKSVSEMSYTEFREYVGQLAERCRQQGAPEAEMELCIRQEATADQARRQKQREIGAAIAAGAQEYNRSMQASRPINCTSTGYGNTVRTRCY